MFDRVQCALCVFGEGLECSIEVRSVNVRARTIAEDRTRSLSEL